MALHHFTHKDSATYGLFVLVAGSILLPCLSAPVSLDGRGLAATDPWWYNACSHQTRHKEMSKLKATCLDTDARTSKLVRQVVTRQMRQFTKFYRQSNTVIKKIYGRVSSVPKKNLTSFEWLPHAAAITPATSRLEQMLVPLHEHLQLFAVAFHQLQTLNLNTNIAFDAAPRARLLRSFVDHLRGLLCEVETAVNMTCQTVPTLKSPSHPDGSTTSKHVDLTALLLHDYTVLTRLSDFVRITAKNINSLAGKKNESGGGADDDSESDASVSSAEQQ